LFPSSPLPGHTHITSHTPKVRRHAVPLHAVQSHVPCRPSAGTGPSGRHALTREPMFALLLSGGAAGIIGWLGTFPFDVIKTCIQAYGISTGPGSSAGEGTLWRTAQELYVEAGGGRMGVFWRLVAATLVTSSLPLIFPHASLAGFSTHHRCHLRYRCHRGMSFIQSHIRPPTNFL